ncbi:prolyl oligopeptidase family serine peptidase [Massilia sp. G4R7]|uniref:Prolyl oligopeptidase family serine peptidase n=1 Tax=Massilia phyllostachyos TaxID=2898585 RepID=A0ABS8Q6I5_9BURK|nr:prolyl oligopeptidase family serine peptidase [Massilia phyllostachyos]MCD2517371.1 prolyl oligopeptidase family serine peptidase [Massilia phyllostachyos]
MRIPALTSFAAAFALALPAAASTPITLDQAMAHPDWIGTPVEAAWFSWDGKQVFYKQKRTGSPIRDTWQVGQDAKPKLVLDAELTKIDGADVIYNRMHTRALMLRNGDLFERDLKSGALVQITRGAAKLNAMQYSSDEGSVQYRIDNDWYGWDRANKVAGPLALLRAAKDPAASEDDPLRTQQLRLSEHLKRQKDDRDAMRERMNEQRRSDPTLPPGPVYLGDKVAVDSSVLSPDGRWLIVVTEPKGADKGRTGKLPRYVTESGYEETEDVRSRVGRAMPPAHTVKLVDLRTNRVQDLSFDVLPGVTTDPLAELRAAAKKDPLKGNRAVRVIDGADAIDWTADGSKVAVMLRAVDNKDRWIATVDLQAAKLQPLHRLTDGAWVNYDNNEFGWLPDNRTLWYLSEESGYSHLYTQDSNGGAPRALTSGKWEASDVRWSKDGATAWVMCNRATPGDYEVCAVDARGGNVKEVTSLDGVERFRLSPDERKLLVHYSSSYTPIQVATVPAGGGAATRLTDTRSDAYKARSWVEPRYVAVPSSAGGDPVWAKLYRPAQLEPGKKYPVVMFVHGAGYLQNVTRRYPNYFREQMFHNLLVQNGYVVLDMDYRASKGYGAKWRTAIYRQMGHPELVDYLDGVNYMVAQQQGDKANVGVYGGSYGGFMTFMALLRAPETFKAGAALRPVTDWVTYNHEYTANILNTPDIDPQAYKISSPIEYADKLQGHLLIAHGMIDDNVFYQDSVRMAQRLIELKKDHWELASYPLERHGYVQPEAWYDQYRRIWQLFERTLKQGK